jgi:hypothetical protein
MGQNCESDAWIPPKRSRLWDTHRMSSGGWADSVIVGLWRPVDAFVNQGDPSEPSFEEMIRSRLEKGPYTAQKQKHVLCFLNLKVDGDAPMSYSRIG